MIYSVQPDIQPVRLAYLTPKQEKIRSLYFTMLAEGGNGSGQIDKSPYSASRAFLLEKLGAAAAIDTDLPTEMLSLPQLLHKSHEQTAKDYRHYLVGRHAGSLRRYFSCRSHAMYFLRAVAPTKLVDGAWLYGLLQHWQDPRLAALIRTYLEELGCGNLQQNHVLLYRQLLARYGCENGQNGPDEHFTQGAVQLALAHHADEFLPELIGFNLGYEQLPLHLLITAYELNIDPYYFSLHVTIDNASTGHARKALQSVLDCAPRIGSVAEFHRRVGNGYRLNFVGMSTNQAIAAFDLEQELLRVLTEKAVTGANLHSDYCLVGGRPVRDWIQADSGIKPTARPTNHFRNRHTARGIEGAAAVLPGSASIEQVISHHARETTRSVRCADVDFLVQQLAGVDSKAEVLGRHGDGWVSRVRASTLRGKLFLHLAYPTTGSDAIFFGPDTYRFTNAVARYLDGDVYLQRAVDIGCGAGPGAVVVALERPEAEVLAVAINDKALGYATVNAHLADATKVVVQHSNLLDCVTGDFDLIVANPPYLLDARERTYRHGGGSLGEGLSLAIAGLAKMRLAPGGTLLLYTCTAIIDGTDQFRASVAPIIDDPCLQWNYQELDPDVFGEELD